MPKEVIRTVEVPKEVIKYVDRVRTVEVPKEVIRTVEVPKEVIKYVDRVKTVEVPREVVRTVEVPRIIEKEVIKYVDRPVPAPAPVASCPSGTILQADQTCAARTFNIPSNSAVQITGGGTASCPSGTTLQANGTCLQSGLAGGLPPLPSPATVPPATTGQHFCYSGGSKIYDSLGHEIGSNCDH